MNDDNIYINYQKQLIWFEEDNPENAPSEEERFWHISEDNPDNPFNNFIGNDKAIKRLKRAAFIALERYNRCCNDQYFALLGPASTGKTTIAKKFAELLQLPFVEISPKSIKKLNDILVRIAQKCEQTSGTFLGMHEYTLELVELEGKKFCLPPMIVFIDEVHALANSIVQGLLKATEIKDKVFVTENGWTVDCENVCWIIATTDRGKLFDAFDTRFTKINLNPYTIDEVSQIVGINYNDWPKSTCDLVAKYSNATPREALAFASEMFLEYKMNPRNLDEIADLIAEENDIDKFGMSKQRLNILLILKEQKNVPKNRLSQMVSCKEEELEKFIIPPMMISTDDRNSLIKIDNKGYSLTEYGTEELVKRGL